MPRVRFGLRHMFVSLAVLAVCIWSCSEVYRRVLIPRWPITWREFDQNILENADRANTAIVVVTGEWSVTGSFADVRFRVESPAIRQLVHERRITCWHYDVSTPSSACEPIRSLLDDPECMPPFVLVMRNQIVKKCAFRNEGTGEATTEWIKRTVKDIEKCEGAVGVREFRP